MRELRHTAPIGFRRTPRHGRAACGATAHRPSPRPIPALLREVHQLLDGALLLVGDPEDHHLVQLLGGAVPEHERGAGVHRLWQALEAVSLPAGGDSPSSWKLLSAPGPRHPPGLFGGNLRGALHEPEGQGGTPVPRRPGRLTPRESGCRHAVARRTAVEGWLRWPTRRFFVMIVEDQAPFRRAAAGVVGVTWPASRWSARPVPARRRSNWRSRWRPSWSSWTSTWRHQRHRGR